jgi:hypothetical protein
MQQIKSIKSLIGMYCFVWEEKDHPEINKIIAQRGQIIGKLKDHYIVEQYLMFSPFLSMQRVDLIPESYFFDSKKTSIFTTKEAFIKDWQYFDEIYNYVFGRKSVDYSEEAFQADLENAKRTLQ